VGRGQCFITDNSDLPEVDSRLRGNDNFGRGSANTGNDQYDLTASYIITCNSDLPEVDSRLRGNDNFGCCSANTGNDQYDLTASYIITCNSDLPGDGFPPSRE
jgi:hypothetical protein